MKSRKYRVETVDKRTVLLQSVEEENEQYTFPLSIFAYEVSKGDIVDVWLEGTHWKTEYLEKETKSAQKHLKEF